MSHAAPISSSSEGQGRYKQHSAATCDLTQADFDKLRAIVMQHTGISLNASKIELVKRRFMPRLRALQLNDFSEYVDYVRDNFDTEGVDFCNAITTNLTSFFRENHHFEMLAILLRTMFARKDRGPAKVRLWSAGCSAGQEAYSLAITLRETLQDLDRLDVKILATDLDENCLQTARNGIYPEKEFDRMPNALKQRYFSQVEPPTGRSQGRFLEASPELKKLITFKKLNLMQPWPMKGKFDFIFCRNVFIYFDKPTQQLILKRFSALQPVGSTLCLGHSEIIPNPPAIGYQMTGKTAYRRV